MADHKAGHEFEIIERYFKPLASGVEGAFGLEDDAAEVSPREGCSLVVTVDAMVEGIHFLDDGLPADTGYKALAVNVSDLCAKGATPVGYLLSLAMPEQIEAEWLKSFVEGLAEAQTAFGCTLLGGDTVNTTGPVAISITAIGELPDGTMIHRSGAKAGDLVYVTGTIGDAVLGLSLLRDKNSEKPALSEEHRTFLSCRHLRPTPRIDVIELVRSYATASMDISDGLVADCEKLAQASVAGSDIEIVKVPLSDAARAWLVSDPTALETLLTGGDDYELLITVQADQESEFKRAASGAGVQVTRIGVICDRKAGITFRDATNRPIVFSRSGFEHFS